jgi:prepilin-type N-terminal cleavage/methylation domain-containing protein
MKNVQVSSQRTHAYGFSLLEMLLVLFLMALMASAGLMLTEGVEGQAKYDETKRRMELMRKAIVGDPTRTVNGSPEISGFVADMGRLPGCVRELLERNDCTDIANALTKWNIDPNSGLGSGWRGPYIQVSPEQDGKLRFRDGYGNSNDAETSDARNFGWNWQIYDTDDNPVLLANFVDSPASAVKIRMQSEGFDPTNANDNYPVGALDDLPALVDEFDHQVSFQDWDKVAVWFENTSGSNIEIPPDSLRLVLTYAGGTAESEPFPIANISIPSASVPGSASVNTGDAITVPPGSSLSGTDLTFSINGKITFPDGFVSITTADTVSVPSGSSLAGSNLILASNGLVTFPAGSTVTLNSTINNLPDRYGSYSLMLVCNDAANPVAVNGKRYDGHCTRYGTDAAPIDYTPRNRPYLFNATPRSTPIMPPSLLIWTIQ